MPERLYHGADGDRILGIVEAGQMKPDNDGRLFFAKYDWRNVLMHGGDRKRKAAFAIAVDLDLPDGASMMPLSSTSGVRDTCVIVSPLPVPVTVVKLFVRAPRQQSVMEIGGATNIIDYLRSRAAAF